MNPRPGRGAGLRLHQGGRHRDGSKLRDDDQRVLTELTSLAAEVTAAACADDTVASGAVIASATPNKSSSLPRSGQPTETRESDMIRP